MLGRDEAFDRLDRRQGSDRADWHEQPNRDGVRRTGKGVVAMLTSPPVCALAYRCWRRAKKNPLVACPETIKRALN